MSSTQFTSNVRDVSADATHAVVTGFTYTDFYDFAANGPLVTGSGGNDAYVAILDAITGQQVFFGMCSSPDQSFGTLVDFSDPTDFVACGDMNISSNQWTDFAGTVVTNGFTAYNSMRQLTMGEIIITMRYLQYKNIHCCHHHQLG